MGVLSYMQGIIHNYYLILLAPPAAALAGIAASGLYELYVRRRWLSLLLPLALSGTVAWEIYILRNHPDWRPWLQPGLLAAASAAAVGLVAARCAARRCSHWRGGALLSATLGLLAVLICPTAWALTPVIARGNTRLPMAYPELLTGQNVPPSLEPGAHGKLLAFLRANRGSGQYLLLTRDLQLAAALIVETGEPIIAPGGFLGSDPALTLDRFKAWVADGRLRFVMADGFPGGPGFGPRGGGGPGRPGGPGLSEVFDWVRQNGQPVSADLWREPRSIADGPGGSPGEFRAGGPPAQNASFFGPGGPGFFRRGPGGRGFPMSGPGIGGQLYDCRPQDGQPLPAT